MPIPRIIVDMSPNRLDASLTPGIPVGGGGGGNIFDYIFIKDQVTGEYVKLTIEDGVLYTEPVEETE